MMRRFLVYLGAAFGMLFLASGASAQQLSTGACAPGYVQECTSKPCPPGMFCTQVMDCRCVAETKPREDWRQPPNQSHWDRDPWDRNQPNRRDRGRWDQGRWDRGGHWDGDLWRWHEKPNRWQGGGWGRNPNACPPRQAQYCGPSRCSPEGFCTRDYLCRCEPGGLPEWERFKPAPAPIDACANIALRQGCTCTDIGGVPSISCGPPTVPPPVSQCPWGQSQYCGPSICSADGICTMDYYCRCEPGGLPNWLR